MPLPADHAARRRDDRLALARRLTLWVAGGAAAASLGLGTAFAHALPGHRASAAGAHPGGSQPVTPEPTRQPTSGQTAGQPTSAPATGGQASTGQPASPPASPLRQPAQPPATTPAPAQTTSGGS
jgi:hypothetical protein